MTTRVVWGESDHETRARGLATAYSTTAHSIGDDPVEIAGLDKMVFWGHGETSKFCGLTSKAFVSLIGEWRAVNSGLRTVEMLTCNARHRQRGSDSYTEQVVNELGRWKHRRARKVNFRALPVAKTAKGQDCSWSILKWHPGTATWAYVAAADVPGDLGRADYLMHQAVVSLEDFKTPRGPHGCYRTAFGAWSRHDPRRMDHPNAGRNDWSAEKIRETTLRDVTVRQFAHISAGTLGMLRWMLVDIK